MKNRLINKKCILIYMLCLTVCVTVFCSCAFPQNGFNFNMDNSLSRSPLNIHFLDVGQGDSVFIELPDEKTMLIDSAESKFGEGIAHYTEDCGYQRIDYLVATHPHADHIGGMTYIVDNMQIGSVYMPRVQTNTKTYENLLDSIYENNLKINAVKAGYMISDTEEYKIEVLAPLDIDENNLNNCSAVIKLTYESKSFLFTGDAETEELNSIKGDVSCDVLKVGHHGSDTSVSEEFLQNSKPDYAVISVGKDNPYGHPDDSALKLLEQFGCRIYRTDTDKTIVISSDGYDISVKSGVRSIEEN